jgi:gluconokinase
MIVVLMGVTGAGKTTIGRKLAARMGVPFADADDYHPAQNKVKMKAGHPLTDEDRQPWLAALNRVLRGWQEEGADGVLACSALRQSYREALNAGLPVGALRFVLLDGSKDLIAARLAHRRHEYMNPDLLDSQLAALEPPGEALVVVNDRAPDSIVDEIFRGLNVRAA